MSNRQKMIGILGFVVVLGTGIENASGQCPDPPAGHDCKCNSGETEWVCATWSDPGDPVENVDFIVTYDGSGVPKVEFVKASTSWEVYSEVISSGVAADLGDVLLASDVEPDGGNFTVTIKKGTGAGAANVSSIVLDSTDVNWTGGSSLKDATIFGNVAGAITLVDDGGMPAEGGDVTGVVVITGYVTGPISIPNVTGSVLIIGNVANAIDIEEISGTFSVKDSADITVSTSLSGSLTASTVPSGKTVTIQNLTITGHVDLATLAGRLELINGIPSSCTGGPCETGSDHAVVAVDVLSSTGVIDLNGADMAGVLTMLQGQNNSQIIAVGAVSGFLYPGFTPSGYFNGTLTVSSVSAIPTVPGITTGEIEVFLGAALNGIINVSGSVAGVVEASGAFTGQINVGSVAAGGVIEAFQDALGTIVVSGALLGTVEVVGDLGGIIRAKGTLGTTGKIEVSEALTGSAKIVVSGMCDGAVQIGKQTDASTLIHLLGGLGSAGSVEINTSRGVFDAGGTIHVGFIAYIFLPDVTYDGCIRIYNDGAGAGGNLNGSITVLGCHETHHTLNICVDGDDNGNINIIQTGCIPVVGAGCGTCP